MHIQTIPINTVHPSDNHHHKHHRNKPKANQHRFKHPWHQKPEHHQNHWTAKELQPIYLIGDCICPLAAYLRNSEDVIRNLQEPVHKTISQFNFFLCHSKVIWQPVYTPWTRPATRLGSSHRTGLFPRTVLGLSSNSWSWSSSRKEMSLGTTHSIKSV